MTYAIGLATEPTNWLAVFFIFLSLLMIVVAEGFKQRFLHEGVLKGLVLNVQLFFGVFLATTALFLQNEFVRMIPDVNLVTVFSELVCVLTIIYAILVLKFWRGQRASMFGGKFTGALFHTVVTLFVVVFAVVFTAVVLNIPVIMANAGVEASTGNYVRLLSLTVVVGLMGGVANSVRF